MSDSDADRPDPTRTDPTPPEIHRDILDALPVAVFVLGADGHPFYANQAATTLLGKGVDPDVDTESLAEVYHAFLAGTERPYPAERMPLVRALAGERTMVSDMEIAHPERRVPIRVWGSPMRDPQGGHPYALAVFVDIASERQAQEVSLHFAGQLEQSDEELREAREQLTRHERLALLGQLAGGVSHDLRHPLATILNVVSTLRRAVEPGDPAAAQLERIARQARRAERIIADLLETSRAGHSEPRATSLERLVALAEEHAALPAGVTIEGPDGGDLEVQVDPEQIARAFANLLLNAAEAMDGAGEIRVRARRAGEQVEVTFEDGGPGIEPALEPHIFEPLVTGKSRGVGLGLMVVRTLVERNAGRVTGASLDGGGAAFVVELPAG